MAHHLTASLEDYLKAICQIVQEKQAARATDIARRLGVNHSSVTGALHQLGERGLINYTPYDLITLTPEGARAAGEVLRCHDALQDFFVKVLMIDPAEAEEAACKMEHVVSRTLLERFIQFLAFVEKCPNRGSEWIEGLGFQCAEGQSESACRQCAAEQPESESLSARAGQRRGTRAAGPKS